MFKVIVAFILGMYVGQEYKDMPNVKKVSHSLYEKMLDM